MKIKMIADDRGAPDGHTVETYVKGEEYDLPKWLAEHFIETDKAELAEKAPPSKK